MTKEIAVRFIKSHGQEVVAVEDERIVAASVVAMRDGSTWLEYETFSAPYYASAIREWLGY